MASYVFGGKDIKKVLASVFMSKKIFVALA